LALEIRDVLRHVAVDQGRVVPLHLVKRRRGDVLARAVELVGDRALVIRPVGREDLVGPASEQQLVGAGLGHPSHHLFIHVVDAPPAQLKAAGWVLVRTAGRLHDTVERYEAVDCEGSH
jgi:hypothetical protein